MSIQKVFVVGAGTMGNGIAQVSAQAGYDVTMSDIKDEFIQKGMAAIEKSLDRMVKKEIIQESEKAAIIARIKTTTDNKDAKDADMVIEAAPEILDLKKSIFKQLDEICRPDAILATNTSSLPIGEIAAITKKPGRVIGIHFMNPVPVMKLVEVIRGLATDDVTTRAVMDLSRELGKTPVEVNDFPGFVSNRVLMPMINEAVYCLMEGVADKEAIDTVMKLGMAHPMGPLTLADFIGLDICLDIMEVLYEGFGDSKYRPCPLLRRMVDAGYLGRKSGQGFYTYE